MALKPRYFVKICTGERWHDPVPLDRDWKLKQYQNPEIRMTLLDDAAAILNIPIEEVRAWVVRVEMIER